GVSSNTSYIESSAGVADGGRTGLTSVVTGVLFLLAIFLSPLAGIVPAQATAPALILVGFLMASLIKGIDFEDIEEGLPALLTMILMTLTCTCTVGAGPAFVMRTLVKDVRCQAREVHWLMWIVTIAFLIYVAQAALLGGAGMG